jgi:Na+-transporting NADH:ubiquinone oxidoreductase subunit A
MIRVKRGLDLPIAGAPGQTIHDGPRIRNVALVGYDYVGLKPSMLVQVGDRVVKGQPLFTDKRNPGVQFTAPATGVVVDIHRGAKRVFQSLVIEVDYGSREQRTFRSWSAGELSGIARKDAVDNLLESGLWTALRTRPFSKVPAPDSLAHAIFVTAMDTNPLAFDPALVIAENAQSFQDGVTILSRLTNGSVYVCQAEGSSFGIKDSRDIHSVEFAGPHPAGLVGTHIHHLSPAGVNNTVWHINYQDVIAIGKLFTSGELYTDRVVSLAGPVVATPRLVRTRMGASTDELTAGQLDEVNSRVISGSVLSGLTARGALAFLGRYHLQVSALEEGDQHVFLGWISPGAKRFSAMRIYLSQFKPNATFAFDTNTNGSPRAMVPIGAYEKVMPLDILPTQLLRALITRDIELAQLLGALELDEEDLALCSYVCPGKYDYGPILRENLNRIDKES